MFGTRVLHKLARLALVLNLPVTSGADIPQNGGNGRSRHVPATEIHALGLVGDNRSQQFDFERAPTPTVVIVSSNPDCLESHGVSIAEAAQRTGLSRHTLRYYERAGLIESVERSTSGRRQYAASDLDWFAFLVRLRQTGMPITQMQQFARLRADGAATLEQRRQLLDEHRRHVEAAIAVQQGHLAALTDKIAHYEQLITGRQGDQM